MNKFEFPYWSYKDTLFNKRTAKTVYNNLVKFCKNRELEKGFSKRYKFENHHIIPRSIGGKDSDDNLVWLTVLEHLFAHFLLTFIYVNQSVCGAYLLMSSSKNITYFNNYKSYEQCKKKLLSWLENAKWYNNGEIEIRLTDDEEIPKGFVLGRLPLGTYEWYSNGKEVIKVFPGEKPPKGYSKGMNTIWITNGDTNIRIFENQDIPEGYYVGFTGVTTDYNWYTNGNDLIKITENDEIPKGYHLGYLLMWYNNGKTNKRVTPEEVKKLGKSWKPGKIMNQTGKHWYSNGKENVFCFEGEQPEGFTLGIHKHWYTNGVDNVFCLPSKKPKGYKLGRTVKKIK